MGEYQGFNHSEFLNLLPELVLELDQELNIKFINESCKSILGISKEELINKKLPIEDFVSPDDIPRLKEVIQKNFNGVFSSGNSYKIFNKNKDELIVEIYNSPIKKDDKVIGLRCIIIDITEKEKTYKELSFQAKHFKQIFQNFPLPYLSINRNGIIADINPSCTNLMKYPREEVIGKNFISFLSKKDKPRVKNLISGFIDKGEINNIQFDLIKEDGSSIFVNFHGKAEYSSEREILRFHCVFNDITLQRKAEQTLIKSELRLRDLNATKDKFFSIIAHDLKNPFNDLMGFTQLLSLNLHKYDSDKIEQFIDIIHQSSKLAYNLLENLLDWSRSQTGTLKFEPEKISINELIKETIELLESTARNKSIQIYAEIETDFYAFADKNMVRTVIRNLLSNAIKYTNQGGHINILCTRIKKNCKVSIEDTGIGISPENIKKILKIDESYTTAGTEKEKGTGLGIILCKEFIEKNKGKLLIKSSLNKGSIFSFTLPLPEIKY